MLWMTLNIVLLSFSEYVGPMAASRRAFVSLYCHTTRWFLSSGTPHALLLFSNALESITSTPETKRAPRLHVDCAILGIKPQSIEPREFDQNQGGG
jgi:hypothetical protein